MGAWFRKYSIRRIAVGGKVKRKDAEGGQKKVVRSKIRFASPTYAQMATIVGLIGVALCLSFIGPDYIAVSGNVALMCARAELRLRFVFAAYNLCLRRRVRLHWI